MDSLNLVLANKKLNGLKTNHTVMDQFNCGFELLQTELSFCLFILLFILFTCVIFLLDNNYIDVYFKIWWFFKVIGLWIVALIIFYNGLMC